MPTYAVSARRPARKLVADEAVHPIRRHYTPSDRVCRDVRGARRRNGCSASRVAFVKTGMECVSDGLRVWSWGVVAAFNAHRTRVREPELRA